ncbi:MULTISPECIES: NAD(P)H-dependent oxidoreductase [Paenibacillus]|uniref:General stress protein n=1 Tax=Paenibacillus borealis TaxID=160799 RepID=A0ABX3H561_PAEBO|nr:MULTISPECIES: NAD(P)H-dependent oxidoreductase [Paenibacillus]AIQ17567.1 general stress protein [Paenibacillus sp. FSL H7-0357]OMD45565.1 general stress protein [Paenibacillus borealis]
MKTLVIITHPNFEQSVVNKRWTEELQGLADVTVHNLHAAYPTEEIDVEREHQLMLEHDRIVLQFPFYWYSSPPLLKKWQDHVLTYGWAIGSEGNKLHGKELMFAVSTGAPKENYHAEGSNKYTVEELLRPLEATGNLIGTLVLPPFIQYGMMGISEEELEISAREYAKAVLA